MKALLIFSNDFHLFFILSTFNTVSLKVFKKICRKKATSEEYREGVRRNRTFWHSIELYGTTSICLKSIFPSTFPSTKNGMVWDEIYPQKEGVLTPQFFFHPLLNLFFIPDHNSWPKRNLSRKFIRIHKSVNSSSRQSSAMKHLSKSNESKNKVLSQGSSYKNSLIKKCAEHPNELKNKVFSTSINSRRFQSLHILHAVNNSK